MTFGVSSLGLGSGLDLNSILSQLRSVERLQLQPLVQKQALFQTQISAFGTLKTALDGFESTIGKLADPKSFEITETIVEEGTEGTAPGEPGPLEVSQTNPGVINFGFTEDTPEGDITVQVNQLATGSSKQTRADVNNINNQLGGSDFSVRIDFSDGSTSNIAFSGTDSLQDVVDGINSAEGGRVTASIFQQGNRFGIRLESDDVGVGNGFDDFQIVDTPDNNGFFGTNTQPTLRNDNGSFVASENAQVSVNGAILQSDDNTFSEANTGIAGFDFTALQAGQTVITFAREPAPGGTPGTDPVIETNIDEVSDDLIDFVKNFVNSYNKINSTIREQRKYDPGSGTGGPLLGNGTIYSVENRIFRTLYGGVDEGDITFLSEVGIERELDGSLSVNEDRLSEVIESDFEGFKTFIQGSDGKGGIAGKLKSVVEDLTAEDGIIEIARKSRETSIDRLEDQKFSMERNINKTLEGFRAQFQALDKAIAELNNSSSNALAQLASLSIPQINVGGKS